MLRALSLVPASIAAAVLAALGLPAAAAQTPHLFAPAMIPLTGHPAAGPDVKVNAGLLADVNGDLQADVVGTSFNSGGMAVILTQDGQLGSTGIAYPSAKNPLHPRVADLDDDGDGDVLVACYGDGVTGPQLWAYFNDGDGGYGEPPVVTNLSDFYSGLTVAALNADTIPDVMLSLGSGVCVVMLGTGGGHFGPEIPQPEVFFPGLLVDDDGDGDADMHYVDFAGWLVYRNDGAGHLQPAQNLGTLAPGVFVPGFEDLDEDGDKDFVFSGSKTDVAGVTVVMQVARNDGTNHFAIEPVQSFFGLPYGSGPILSDLDGDGDPDAVFYDTEDGFVGTQGLLVMRNGGTGAFSVSQRIDYPGQLDWWNVSAGDVTGDGLPEVAVFASYCAIPHESLGAKGLAAPKAVPVVAGPPTQFGSGGTILRTGDFKLDGKLDALVSTGSGASGALSVLLNVNAGLPPQVLPIGATVVDVALADFNRDTFVDLAVARGTPTNDVLVLSGNGAGGFAAPVPLAIATAPKALETADVNGDGAPDLLVLHQGLSVFLGNGAGAFGAPIFSPACPASCQGFTDMAVADVDTDGLPDVVVTHPQFAFDGPKFSVLHGTGTGAFTLLGTTPTGVAEPQLADVTGDGLIDFVGFVPGIGVAFEVRAGLGNGSFAPAAQFGQLTPQGTAVGGPLALGDADGDGALDVFLGGGAVWLNNGAGAFTLGDFLVIPDAQAVALADLDHDAQLDALVLQPVKSRLSLMHNLTECNGFAAAYGLPACWGTNGIGPQLSVSGVPSPGGTFSLHVEGMLGGAPAQLWVSPTPVILPVGLGASLYVSPAGLISVPLALSGPPVPGFGQATLTVPLSPSLPPGLSIALEAVATDAGSPFGFSGTNGLFLVIQ